MKLVIASLLLALAPASSFAWSSDYNAGGVMFPGLEEQVLYTSWCNYNEVTTQDSKGDLVVLENCADSGKVCRSRESRRGVRTVVSAYCSVQ